MYIKSIRIIVAALIFALIPSCSDLSDATDYYTEMDFTPLSSLPYYWIEYLKSVKDQIKKKEELLSQKQDSFFFLTDYHIESNAGLSHQVIDYLTTTTNINNLVFGGDIFNGSNNKDIASGYLAEFQNRFSFIKLFGIRGNHDNNLLDGGSRSVMLSNTDLFHVFVEPIVEEVTVGKDSLYYFRDVSNLQLRYFYLDSENVKDTDEDIQMCWLKEHITELSDEWSVIIFIHRLFSSVKPGNVVTTHPGYCKTGSRLIETLTTLDSKAKIIAVISGHVHYDYSTSIHGFWEVSTTCDGRQEYGGLPTTLGTVDENAFDIFTIDLDSRIINATRIGRGNSRHWEY